MTEWQAAIGITQLHRQQTFTEQRQRNASFLRNKLKKFRIVGGDYALVVFVQDRDAVRQYLTEKLIETSVYYPRPVPHYSYYSDKYGSQSYPVAESFCQNAICLPIGPHLRSDDMDFIAEEFKKCALPL
jgi:dTDP-4-amino-4,6-dideoxygalactose transaminase